MNIDKNDKILYPYRVFTVSNVFRVLSEYSSIDSLWNTILSSDDCIEFCYPNRDGSSEFISMRLKSSYVIAIDDSYGKEQYVASKEIVRNTTKPDKNSSIKNVGQSVGGRKG